MGLNCALGAEQLRPHLEDLARRAHVPVSAHPNAGLPNDMGGYDQTPDEMAGLLAGFARDGLVNLVGSCCGSTPEFTRAIVEQLQGLAPRRVPRPVPGTHLSGLEPLHITDQSLLVNVGERTNVAGSRKFAGLIQEGRFEDALQVARQQVRGGAQILDVNMDDALLDGPDSMRRFLLLLATDPEMARIPVMIDSSRWAVLEAGLECLQGKCVVNSISASRKARTSSDGRPAPCGTTGRPPWSCVSTRRARPTPWSAAAPLPAALTTSSCTRKTGIPADVVLDANVFAVATGLPEHDRYALDFIEAVRWIKAELPGALTSGGISNLSFSFRGNDAVREAMHAVFLFHAVQAGLDLAIVNAGRLPVYDGHRPRAARGGRGRDPVPSPDAADRLTDMAQRFHGIKRVDTEDLSWREGTVAERLHYALVHGVGDHVAADTQLALDQLIEPLKVIEGPLMAGMDTVGDLFGAGKMFLPQVIRSARVMKQAVKVLEPYLLAARQSGHNRGKVLLATVKGDVHDIGKNIVGVVLACNNYEVVDLGVMVSADRSSRRRGARTWTSSG